MPTRQDKWDCYVTIIENPENASWYTWRLHTIWCDNMEQSWVNLRGECTYWHIANCLFIFDAIFFMFIAVIRASLEAKPVPDLYDIFRIAASEGANEALVFRIVNQELSDAAREEILRKVCSSVYDRYSIRL